MASTQVYLVQLLSLAEIHPVERILSTPDPTAIPHFQGARRAHLNPVMLHRRAVICVQHHWLDNRVLAGYANPTEAKFYFASDRPCRGVHHDYEGFETPRFRSRRCGERREAA
jgi:hypothetical protein